MINLRKTSSLVSMVLLLCFSMMSIEAKAVGQDKNVQVVSSQGLEQGSNTLTDKQDKEKSKNNKDSDDEDKVENGEKTNDENKSDNSEKTSDEDKVDNSEDTEDKEEVSSEDNEDKTNVDDKKEEEVVHFQWLKVHDKLFYYVNGKLYEEEGWFNESTINPEASEDKLYYIDDDGSAVTGWREFADKWYYFDENGVMQTGWKNIKYGWYYFDKYGEMKTGWIEDEGDKYYLYESGNMATGKKYIDGNWYYFGTTGKLLVGRYYNNGKVYYSNKDGIMVADKWISINGNDYYVKTDSSLAVGKIIIDGKLETFDSSGKHIESEDINVPYLFVKQLNVGDADCAFIKLPNKETALIDTGTPESSKKLIDFLKEQKLKKSGDKYKIDYVIITHGHSDHIGGLRAVLENFDVKKVYMPDIAKMKNWASGVVETEENKKDLEMLRYDYKVYKDAVKAMEENDIEFTNTEKGEYIDKGNILQFVQSDLHFGPVGPDKLTADYWGINDNSAIVHLNYGNFQMLFTGDMEWTSERNFRVNKLLNGKEVDVLKVGHHGNDTSSTGDFISYVKAPIGIISRSEERVTENRAYKDLLDKGVSIYETSASDGISIYATSDNWTFAKENLKR
ncbi:MAG: MBL fold metallo-hydrolase [Clostridium butyricum]|nr:MBL fold metallo-hydrolase [Clostridium butyricum]